MVLILVFNREFEKSVLKSIILFASKCLWDKQQWIFYQTVCFSMSSHLSIKSSKNGFPPNSSSSSLISLVSLSSVFSQCSKVPEFRSRSTTVIRRSTSDVFCFKMSFEFKSVKLIIEMKKNDNKQAKHTQHCNVLAMVVDVVSQWKGELSLCDITTDALLISILKTKEKF